MKSHSEKPAKESKAVSHIFQNQPGNGLSLSPPIKRRKNDTGLPDTLKNGAESLSGISLDDVNVHYNSSKPAHLNAHAYAQGTDIHVGSGQEKYLPHEAWHVVQQKQGRVKPTFQMKEKVNINDDAGLEKEADVMGLKSKRIGENFAANISENSPSDSFATSTDKTTKLLPKNGSSINNTVQRWNIRTNPIDWSQTRAVEPLVDRPVLFFDDGNNERIVVKGEDVSIGKTQLANMLHKQIDGSNVVYTKDISADKNTINTIIDDPVQSGNHPNWEQIAIKYPKILPNNYPNLANLTDDEKGRKSRQEHLNILPKLQVMDFVTGKTADKLSQVDGNSGNYKTMRWLLLDDNHVKQLGKITAVDLFLENDDRALAGNLGNWMVDQAGGITLIDQLNDHAMNLLNDDGTGANKIIGPNTTLLMIAPGQIPATAVTCVDAILTSMYNAGDATVKEWSNDSGGAVKNKIVHNFTIGLKEGVSELKKHIYSKKRQKKGRALKQNTALFENTDRRSQDGPAIHFWDRLKARAELL